MKDGAITLVIDADVFQSASTARSGQGAACRRVLEVVRALDYVLAVSEAWLDEFKRHRSGFSHTWLRSMHARKRVRRLEPSAELLEQVRGAIDSVLADPGRGAALKDAHLVALALESDRRILSRERKARGLFADCAKSNGWLETVVWISPENAECLAWLEAGASIVREHCLGFVPSN